MELFEKLKERALTQTLGAFVQANPGLYLLGRLPVADSLSFKTRLADPTGVRDPGEVAVGREGDFFLVRVEKTGRNSWSRQISIGRATNNDIVIRHPSISKLHAHFFVRLVGSEEALLLADDGSSNGSYVNNRSLDEGDEAALVVRPGDRLRFGDLEVTLLDPAGLHKALRRRTLMPSDF